jgi:hypothetical protein
MQLSVNVYVSAVCNIVADIVLVAFAVPRVCEFAPCVGFSCAHSHATVPLNMPRSQKIAVLTVVSLGILVIAAAIVRCISVIKLPLDDSLCKLTFYLHNYVLQDLQAN